MMTSAAMFAHSSLASAPNTSEILSNVPGAPYSTAPARRAPVSRMVTASSRSPDGGAAARTALPNSDTSPASHGPDVPSFRHSCHCKAADPKRSNRRRWSTVRICAGTLIAKTFCTFRPSISMPSRESASATTVGAGSSSISRTIGSPCGRRTITSGRFPPSRVSAAAEKSSRSRNIRANTSLMMLS